MNVSTEIDIYIEIDQDREKVCFNLQSDQINIVVLCCGTLYKVTLVYATVIYIYIYIYIYFYYMLFQTETETDKETETETIEFNKQI